MKYVAYALLAALASFGVAGCASLYQVTADGHYQVSPDGNPWLPKYPEASAAAGASASAASASSTSVPPISPPPVSSPPMSAIP
jgi:hypothetical protein